MTVRADAGRRAAFAAWTVWVFCFTVSVGALILGLAIGLSGMWSMPFLEVEPVWFVGLVAGSLPFPTVGAVVAARLPHNVIGWLFLGFGLAWSMGLLALMYASSGSVLGREYAGWFFTISVNNPALYPVVFTLLLLTFPDGRLRSMRSRSVAWTSVVAAALFTGLWAISPFETTVTPYANPFWLPSVAPLVSLLGLPLAAIVWACVPVAAVSFVVHYRRSSSVERLQLRWFASAGTLLAAVIASAPLLMYLEWFWLLPWPVLFVLGANVLAVAAGIAITRYRLYEIDRIISRTVSYALLSALLVAVYLGAVFALQQLLSPVTGESQLAVAGATLAVAALFGPLRRRVQVVVDRRFNRARYDAQRIIEQFRHRLRDEVDLEQLNAELVGAVRSTVQPDQVSLWLRDDARPGR